MKILHLSWEFPPRKIGGLGVHVHWLSREQAKTHEVHVVTCDFPDTPFEETVNGVHVHRFDSYSVPTPDFHTWAITMNSSMRDRAIDLIKEIDGVDIIHSHDWLAAIAGISLKNLFRIPLISTIHSTEIGRRRGLHDDGQRMIHDIEARLCYESWRVITCSQYMKKEVQSNFNVPLDKLRVIPNGVNIDERHSNVDCKEFMKRFKDRDSQKIIFYVGRLVFEKGVHVLLGAIPMIDRFRHDFKVIIAGSGYYHSELERITHQLGIQDRVKFVGFLTDDEIKALYKCATVSVFPSLYEPFGITALEAMASEVPVIVSDTGGLSEIVQHDITGLKFYVDNSHSLASQLTRVLENEEFARKVAKNAVKELRKRYDWGEIAKKTVELYEEVIKEHEKSSWKLKNLKK
ncbi:MAG: glycosyltransferase family 4 protein [Candidatus Helarchaeales archaeon]